MIPAVKNAISAAILMADPIFLEPMLEIFISIPQNMLGNVTKDLQGRRARITDMKAEGEFVTVKAIAPVAEMFGFASDIRSATEGRAIWSTEFAGYEQLPQSMFHDKVMEVRRRKGLKLEMPQPSDFISP